MRAQFPEDGDIEEEKCTLENTSKMQLSRLTVESIMTLSVCFRLKQRSQEDINLIEGSTVSLDNCSFEVFLSVHFSSFISPSSGNWAIIPDRFQ